ncbi:hypothetical protein GCM10009801_49320 [Streptomyces albiaxialis]|uniref:OmpR/PhoB-type domain-containing protein n=1 Tax=Streptomyces albiaxialis TaxID=329523 RepID=A0ABN2W9G8_9ACTN
MIAGTRPRLLLALLLLHAPTAVSSRRILDDLWSGAPAKNPPAALHTTVAKLRRTLQPHAPGLVVTAPAGYRLNLEGHTLDVHEFEAGVARARTTADPGQRAALLRGALARWTGEPLAGLPALPFVQAERARLEALWLAALEDRAEAELTAGPTPGADLSALVETVRAAAAARPQRERLQALLIRALHRCGRQAEALEVYGAARAYLRGRLGIEPGPELREAQRAVLHGLTGPETGPHRAPIPAPAQSPAQSPERPPAQPPAAPYPAVELHMAPETRTAAPEVLAVPPDGLDVRTGSFVGRSAELADISARLEQSRLVTVVGAAGIGKTRLACVAAARAQAAGATVWRVDLVPCAPGAPEDVPEAVAARLRIPSAGPVRPGEAARERMRAVVERSASPLLLLDNCEHVVAAVGELVVGLLADCPGLRILATSRESLGVTDESRLPLAELSPDDAERLFRDRLLRLAPDAERAAASDDVREVCEAVGRMPLGIELVAPKAASAPLPAIGAQLRSQRGLLDAPLRSADARHLTLRAAIDWSYGLLTDGERAVLRALSVFSAPFPQGAAEAVAGPAAAAALPRLAEKSLVVYDPGRPQGPARGSGPRYRMLVPLRQYARAELAARGEEAPVRHRHASWVAALAERSAAAWRTGGYAAAFAETDAASAEISACLDWLQDGGGAATPADAAAARALAGRTATRLALYWSAAGQGEEGHQRLGRALEDAAGDEDWFPEALAWCGWLAVNIRQDEEEAAELLRRAVPAADKTGDPAVVTLVGALALTAHVRQERLAEARDVARRTGPALDGRAHRWETGIWRLFHSELLVAEGAHAPALTSALTARELLAPLDPHSAATAGTMVGMAYERLGERALSLRAFHAAHDELRALGSEHEAAYLQAVLACAAVGDADWEGAAAHADALEDHARESTERYFLAKAETVRALIAHARGAPERAEALLARSAERYEAANRPECAAHDLTRLGTLAAERGEEVLAQVRWENALDTARRSGRRYAEIRPLRALVALREARHDDEGAAELRDRLAAAQRDASACRTTECPFHLAVPEGQAR